MKKIIIFGDSFAKDQQRKVKNWVDYLGDILQLPVVNYGHWGSSIGYALTEFMTYFNSDEYDPEDIIIFMVTTNNRVFYQNMPYPELGCNLVGGNPEMQSYVDKHFDKLLWAREKVFTDFEDIQLISFLQAIAGCSPNTFVTLNCFTVRNIELLTKITKPSANFLPIVMSNLFKASLGEFIKEPEGAISEQRVNHFSTENLVILADQISKVIICRDVSKFDSTLFKSKFM